MKTQAIPAIAFALVKKKNPVIDPMEIYIAHQLAEYTLGKDEKIVKVKITQLTK